jgi:hypothetical protein
MRQNNTMNPLTYKAHPLLSDWIGLITQTSENPGQDLRHVLLLLAVTTPVFALALKRITQKQDEISLPVIQCLGLAIPSAVLYTPLVLTFLNDVIHHAFVFSERWFLLFALIVASQMLAAFYAFLIHSPRERGPVGIDSGLGASLFLLLISIPMGFALIGCDALFRIF